jgi:hypothetical protein
MRIDRNNSRYLLLYMFEETKSEFTRLWDERQERGKIFHSGLFTADTDETGRSRPVVTTALRTCFPGEATPLLHRVLNVRSKRVC